MTTMRRNSFTRTIGMLLSFMLTLALLVPYGEGGTAFARPAPTAPAYTGPLTWMDYTARSEMSGIGPVPYSLAFDGQDNLYVTKFTPIVSNGPGIASKVEIISKYDQSVTDITYDLEGTYTVGIAVDYNENVYVTDNSTGGNYGSNVARILQLQSGTSSWTDITNGLTLRYAMGIAADRQGNVYVVDSDNTNSSGSIAKPKVFKLASGQHSWTDISDASFPSSVSFDIVVDTLGNLFVTFIPYSGIGSSYGRVFKLEHGESTWSDVTPTTEQGSFPFIPYGLSVDQFDNVYVVNMINGGIKKLGNNGGSDDWTEFVIMSDPLSYVSNFDVAVDSLGYIYSTNLVRRNVNTLMATVIYNGMGNTSGTVPTEQQHGYKPDETAVVAGKGDMEKIDHTFSGWDTSSTATTAVYAAGDIIPMTQSVTLYAVWTPIPTITLTGLQLDSTNYSLLNGDTHQTVVTAVYSDTSTLDVSSGTVYTSSDTNIATVNEAGLVTAKASGQAVVTAEYEGQQAQATVTVSARPDTSEASSGTPTNQGIEIIVDGVKQGQLATAKQETVDGRKVTTVELDSGKVSEKLNRDNSKMLTIPVSGDSKVVAGQLDGSLVKLLETHDAQIQIATDRASYTLPASQINIEAISEKFGAGVKLEDLKISIQISEASDDHKAQAQATTQTNGSQLLVTPVDFEVVVSYKGQTVKLDNFSNYVERTITIPDGVDPNQITTAVVVEQDGTIRHVPTKVVVSGGKYYAQINSLSNSTYAVVWHPLAFDDVAKHWAKDAVNSMGSRMIIEGAGNGLFNPDKDITRAEFASILVRGLGLKPSDGASPFSDVKAQDWYSNAVSTAYGYGLVAGFEDGSFRPNDNVTREQAMVMMAKAMQITELTSKTSGVETILAQFADVNQLSSWAREGVVDCIGAQLVSGRNSDMLAPKANMTRAEVASIVQRLLQKSELI
ncbi:S-layer homology domain-containing protein [Paenibacillus qinlingensis]|uniref:S-layer homology domain-containing protein n=1 Tax=Paenibacillus qinlingensis TaxID=1837343 RepID=UPI0015674781|nr:S-layer homology domain-containing protein [Paenibacillus qinlingensis]NQX63329.1 S-layer homology domain-containing protein [Paenibacillus qinlingensis]